MDNSKFFHIDDDDNVISIYPVKKISFSYEKKNLKNILTSKGEFYNLPFSIKWSSDLKNKINKTFLKLNKINVRVENLTLKEKNNLSIKNYIFFRSSEIETDLKVYESFIEFKSTEESKIKNNRLSYFGKINKNPFHLNMNLNLEKLNFKKNIFENNFLRNLFELRQFYSENLSSKINLRVNKMLKNKLFDSSNILINFANGDIKFNNSIFNGKAGNLNLINGNIGNIKDDLIFNGNFVFDIVSKDDFYRLFQINKKYRKKIDTTFFNVEYNLTKNKIQISNLLIEPGKIVFEDELSSFLEEHSRQLKINSWIDFKSFVKKIFINYYEG